MNFYRCIEFVGQIRTQMSDHRPFICHLRFLFSIWKIETRCARFRYAVHDALQCDSAGYSNRHSNDAAISCLEIVINLDFALDASHIFLYQNQTCFAAMRREFFLSHDSFFSRPCTWNKAINSAMRCVCVCCRPISMPTDTIDTKRKMYLMCTSDDIIGKFSL